MLLTYRDRQQAGSYTSGDVAKAVTMGLASRGLLTAIKASPAATP